MLSMITIAMMVLSINAQAEWGQWSSEDPMNDTVRKGMASALTAPMKMMSFPYQDTKAILGVSCDDTGAYMRFTNSPNLSGDTTHDGYNSIRLRVRKDNDQVRGIKFVQNWGSDQLSTTFLPMRNIVMEGQTLLVEIPWHGQGKVYFKFDLTGSSDMYKRTCHERILQDKANAEKRAKDSARLEKERAEEAKRLKDLADKRAALNSAFTAKYPRRSSSPRLVQDIKAATGTPCRIRYTASSISPEGIVIACKGSQDRLWKTDGNIVTLSR